MYDGFAEVAKALAGGRRARIVDVLAQGERSVGGRHLPSPAGQARAGLVTTRRDGMRIFYARASERVAELWDVAAESVAALERLAAAYLGDRDGVGVVDRTELVRRLSRREVVLLDVRPAAESAAGHITRARSAPITELRRHLRARPKDTDVVAYCRGAYCAYGDDAVRELNGKGFRARRLIDGFPEWKRAGLPVAVGEGA